MKKRYVPVDTVFTCPKCDFYAKTMWAVLNHQKNENHR